MFPRNQYLEWAVTHLGRSPFDLAISGMPIFSLSELGPPPALEDPGAWLLLRSAIARANARPADEAIAALGTTQALWLVYSTLTSPGDEILIEFPAYEPLRSIAEGVGARVTRFERRADRRYAIDPDAVAAQITPRTRLVVVTNLHNPTGTRADDAALREVARLVGAQGAHLLVNEVYAPFDTLADADGIWHNSARHLADNIVTTASLTKCYGLGPQRFGWVLGPPDFIARAQMTMLNAINALPISHMQMFLFALAHLPDLSARSRRLLGNKRARVAAWIAQEHPRFTWSDPQSGLFGLATLPGAGDLRVALEAGAAAHGAQVVPGSFFEVPNGFRLSWSIDDPRLDEALARLGRILLPI